ncbi:hypothetical protein BaRGS_00013466 [Batillaria attramentaria]|uniref:Uncharacterized protein n=1 Tax=Batillaria attramentaria TaxID=370345 RepID=A0ABD0L6Q7_9CAEN
MVTGPNLSEGFPLRLMEGREKKTNSANCQNNRRRWRTDTGDEASELLPTHRKQHGFDGRTSFSQLPAWTPTTTSRTAERIACLLGITHHVTRD